MNLPVPRQMPLAALLCILCASIFAQGPGVFAGEARTRASHGLADLDALDRTFTNYAVFAVDGAAVNAHARLSDGWTTVRLKLGNEFDWDLSLVKHDLRSADYVCRVGSADGRVEMLPRGEASTYKGHLNNDAGSIARFSIRDNAIMGMVVSGSGEEHYIEPLSHFSATADADLFVVYRPQDVIADAAVSCGNTEMGRIADGIGSAAAKDGDRACMLADIAVAADGSMTAFLGGTSGVETRVIDILNWVDGKYQDPRIEIAYRLVTTFVSPNTAADPWNTTNDAQAILNSFISWGNGGGFGTGITYAVASLWTKRDIAYSGNTGVIGLAAGFATICNSDRYNLNEHYSTPMAGPAVCQTHELGHNWSAQHTPSSNSTQIMSPGIGSNNSEWDNASITAIVNHKNSRTCLGSSCAVPPFAQFAADRTTSCDGVVAFTDQSSANSASWLWDFGDGNTSADQNPTHTYTASGTYTVQLTVTNPSGQDTETKPSYVTVNRLDPPTATDGIRCGPGLVDLEASGSHTLRWYTDPTGGTQVHTGTTYSPNITANTIWYVENSSEGDPANVGPASNTIGAGGYPAFLAELYAMVFNVHRPITLKSVKVYSNAAGNRTIQLLDISGTVLQSRVVNIPNGESRVTLDMDIAPDNQYQIKVAASPVNLYRNTAGASYPYEIPGLVSITGNNGGITTASNYFYFYDWIVQEPGCVSARVPVNGLMDVCTGMDGPGRGAFSVHPNPSQGRFLVEWGASADPPARIEVLNALGQRIMEGRVEGGTSLPLWIDAGQGMYFLRAFGRQGNLIGDGKLVIQ